MPRIIYSLTWTVEPAPGKPATETFVVAEESCRLGYGRGPAYLPAPHLEAADPSKERYERPRYPVDSPMRREALLGLLAVNAVEQGREPEPNSTFRNLGSVVGVNPSVPAYRHRCDEAQKGERNQKS
jgi:hypothetical protein